MRWKPGCCLPAGLLLGDSGAAPAEAGGMGARLGRGRPIQPRVPSPVGLCGPRTLPGMGGNGEFGEILATEGSGWPEGCWCGTCRVQRASVVMLKPTGAWNVSREQIEANCKAIDSGAVVWVNLLAGQMPKPDACALSPRTDCCQTLASAGVPVAARPVPALEACKPRGAPPCTGPRVLHLSWSPPAHCFSTLPHPTVVWKVRNRAFLPKNIICEPWVGTRLCEGWLAEKSLAQEGQLPQATAPSLLYLWTRCWDALTITGFISPIVTTNGNLWYPNHKPHESPRSWAQMRISPFPRSHRHKPSLLQTSPRCAFPTFISFKNTQRAHVNETNNLVVIIHRLLTRWMRFLGSNALCYSRAS